MKHTLSAIVTGLLASGIACNAQASQGLSGEIGFLLGYRYTLNPESHLSLSLLPGVVDGKTWADPYLVDVTRQETDVAGNLRAGVLSASAL
ncbi:DUF2860 family protein [Photobacterium atrarenae]|uniref:DUF2860 domain-containing protein n=1 Tax=Photobacterium atrarenae TaxID=865757 RepID=A0ABY5GJQ7_9GAMM|nr:DUF2860 family protein [Photobacterium atrarenae]UTV29554.1 DUF2860 domain-containing protein [Photobacterium atrarenae]